MKKVLTALLALSVTAMLCNAADFSSVDKSDYPKKSSKTKTYPKK